MNLREKAQSVARSYEEITADAEKYILAAIDSLNDKRPTSIECESIALGGTEDGTHTHIIVDNESKLVIDVDDNEVRITLDETGESVTLNEKDANEVRELFFDKLQVLLEEKKKARCPARGLLEHILVAPLVINDLKKAGKDPMDITPRELQQLIDEKVAEIKNKA